MIIQHTVTRRHDEYSYFFCRNRQQRTCQSPDVHVAVVEEAAERYYATVSQQQITEAIAMFTRGDTVDHDPGR